MKPDFLMSIRERELALVQPLMPPGARVLELGAGAGWQARKLQDAGFHVAAVDVPTSEYTEWRIFPVTEYDGVHLPFADQSFDVVFSSNVLEHIPPGNPVLQETRRVLKPDGVAIHILPSATWRFWSTITETLHRFRYGLRGWLVGRTPTHQLWPKRHGERGTLWSELYYFSRYFWLREFARGGWQLVRRLPNRLFYTGSMLLAGNLPLAVRSLLSRVLGSSCQIYVIRSRP